MKTGWKNRILFLLFVTLLMSALALGLRLRLEQRRLAAELIRLHVVANSDTPADQQTKLLIRDRVLPVIAGLTDGCRDAASARRALEAGIPEIRAAASEALDACSVDGTAGEAGDPVTVTLTEEAFPRRDYETFSLPAGRYTALRIRLGEGQGHNWWCVAFPALCLPAAAEFEETARSAGLDEDQIRLLTGSEPSVQVKFRLLDWLGALFG